MAWLLAAVAAAALTSMLTAGRATLLIEQGLVNNQATMHLHGFVVSLVMALLYFAHLRRSRAHEQAASRLATAQRAQRLTHRRIAEARLQEMQARVDPQGLFQMLATARGLYDRDAAKGERFLDEVILFLRAALPRLRNASSSLLREVELARAFVNLHAIAGTAKLGMTTDVAPDALHARFPPGVLLPLLDSAVTSNRAGRCRLSASCSSAGCQLVLALAAAPSAQSVARVRSLLAELYGAAGRLEIAGQDGAIQVIVEVPYELA
jgi:LytS/YehU family sensor histidine kinase